MSRLKEKKKQKRKKRARIRVLNRRKILQTEAKIQKELDKIKRELEPKGHTIRNSNEIGTKSDKVD